MAYSTITKPTDYFTPIIYTGDNASSRTFTTGFYPDWIIVKPRSVSGSHRVSDSVRGLEILYTNGTNAEDPETTNNEVVYTRSSTGYTTRNSDAGVQNSSGETYVNWCWNAGSGSTVSNTDGSITSSVSANTTSGFSIVSFTGTGANATVGHGLSSAPKMVIFKNRDNGTQEWDTYHAGLTDATYFIQLNSTNAQSNTNGALRFNSTAPTSSVFSVGTSTTTNESGNAMIAYCFAEKKGYSKFGKYTGNGSSDGTFIYTGFRPAFTMVKRTDGIGNWIVMDNKRSPFNLTDNRLLPNASDAEATSGNSIDILSNGFKNRTNDGYNNASGGTYIYMAFAENPLVANTGGGIPATAR